ncbi:MAG: RHS repeat-associated core domain-containing protein [Candidatus Omnitrophica bacterium]|nr:RHS repeat-associated core domain-containing protein [Candidatus Omnitrophota bacterium]
MGSRIDEPLTMTRSSTTYYYFTDGLGSVRQLANSSGTIVESYDYDPYGGTTIYDSSLTDITSSGSSIDNPYMFTGRRFDEETGIYHYRRRTYDPSIGRFLQRDPLGYYDSMNLYEYVRSNPINYVDPDGLAIDWVIVGITVGIIALGAAAADYIANRYKDLNEDLWLPEGEGGLANPDGTYDPEDWEEIKEGLNDPGDIFIPIQPPKGEEKKDEQCETGQGGSK